MNGTTKKNFGKSGRSGAVLTLAGLFIMAMALVFGFAACGGDEDEDDPIASAYQGTYTGTLVKGTASDTSVTVSADAITGTNVTISNVSTSGGGSLTIGSSASWMYVLEGSAKIGVAYTISGAGTSDGTFISLGKTNATTLAGYNVGFTTANADEVSTTYGAYLTKQ